MNFRDNVGTILYPVLVGSSSDSMDDWGTIDLKKNELMSFRLIASITGPDISVIFQHVQTNNKIWGNLTCNASMHGEYIAFGGHGYDPSVDESYYGRFKFGIRNIRVGQEFMPTT